MNPANATSLEKLMTALRSGDPDNSVDWTRLPSFGGVDPADTRQVWSWDETRLLVGTCADDLQIVSRRRWERDCESCGTHGVGLCAECEMRHSEYPIAEIADRRRSSPRYSPEDY